MDRHFLTQPSPQEPNNGPIPNPQTVPGRPEETNGQTSSGQGLLSRYKQQQMGNGSNGSRHPYSNVYPPTPDIAQQETIQQPPVRAERTPYAAPTMPAQQWQQPNAQPFPPQPRPAPQQALPPPATNLNQPAPRRKKTVKKKRRFSIWARVVLAVLTLILVLTGSAYWYYEATFAVPISKITGQTVTRLKGDEAPNSNQSTGGGALGGNRINILLLGSDDDYKSVVINGGVLAQTDIVVTIDPATKSVGMLSIPRDSLVNIPGHGIDKLDKAYLFGGGGANGAALSMATIHANFGIYVDHYAWVGLSGFVKVIDTVGGIDIDVIHPITDDVYPDDTGKGALDPYALKRLYIPPGPQHLNGLHALEYVRSRHADLVGDFGRSARQQQLLDQLKTKLDNPGIVGELPQLAQDLSGFVKTDMQLTDVFKLMYFARGLDSTKINRVVLDGQYSRVVDSYPIPNEPNQSVVILNCSKVQALIAQMFKLGSQAACNTGVSYRNGSISEAAAVAAKPQPLPPVTASSLAVGNNTWQTLSRIYNTGAMGLHLGNSDWFGIHSLLDLMLLVVCESPIALQT